MYRSGISVLGSPRAGMALCLVGSLAAFCAGPVRVACAQAPAASAFEVASIKPSGPADPGRAALGEINENTIPRFLYSISGRRLEARGRTIAQLVAAAYQIPVREIVGPSWMSEARFDVEGLIPASQIPEGGSGKKPSDTLERQPQKCFGLCSQSASPSKPIMRIAGCPGTFCPSERVARSSRSPARLCQPTPRRT